MGSCKFLDHGYHNAKAQGDAPDLTTPIVYYEFHYKTYLLHRINSTAKLSPYLSDYSRRSLRYFVQRKYHNHHCAEDLLLSKYEYLSNEVRRLGVNEKRLFERVPPSGIRVWMAWLKLRRSISNLLAALEERWENGRHVVQRILRGLISGP